VAGSCGEESMSSVVRNWSLEGEEVVPSAILMTFPLNVSLLMVRCFGAIVDLIEAFGGRDLECKNLDLNKSTKCGGGFLTRLIR